MQTPPLIRAGLPSEVEALSALAVRSKAYWGYDDAFLRAVRRDLEITAAQFETWIVCVLTEADQVRGFYALRPVDVRTVDLERLFVDPTALGRGYGQQLFEHAADTSRTRGYGGIDIASDPYAEGFYLRLGAFRVGEVPSRVPGRTLPLLRFDLA